MSDPFKVRLTGSSAGTLGQVIVQIELVDRAVARYPKPWAWYRGDDLIGFAESDPLGTWPDRAGGAGSLLSDSAAPHYTADALDSTAGVKSAGSPSGDLDAASFPSPLASGTDFTIVCVLGTQGGSTHSGIMGFYSGSSAVATLSWASEFNAISALVGSDADFDPVYITKSGTVAPPLAMVLTKRSGTFDFWVDRTLIGSETPANIATPPNVIEMVVGDDSTSPEMIFFDFGVDPATDLIDFGADGTQTIDAYLSSRYPSLP